jgi:molybdopterin biosynthesis enzyme
MVHANCLIVLMHQQGHVAIGEEVHVMMLDALL